MEVDLRIGGGGWITRGMGKMHSQKKEKEIEKREGEEETHMINTQNQRHRN